MYSTGWVNDPKEVQRLVDMIGYRQGLPAVYSQVATASADEESTVLFWKAEEKVLGKVLGSWNQGQVGSCVSFGYGRNAQDLALIQIALGEAQEWGGAEVATEPIYGGSRVEVGGGRIGGDGSVGAWAAEWVRRWGLLFRQVYGNEDLRTYNESRCRKYGSYGCPDDLEPIARERPIQTVAQVRTGEECWNAIGSWHPVPVCSDQGFTTRLVEGFCEPSGSWAHCMAIRGRFVSKKRGKSFVIQNSWGSYLSGDRYIEDKDGNRYELPEGCFATTLSVVDRMMRQDDSFVLSAYKGFPVRKLNWLI